MAPVPRQDRRRTAGGQPAALEDSRSECDAAALVLTRQAPDLVTMIGPEQPRLRGFGLPACRGSNERAVPRRLAEAPLAAIDRSAIDDADMAARPEALRQQCVAKRKRRFADLADGLAR